MGVGDVGAGAASGAVAGSFGGPLGAVIGAGIGATASIFGSKKQAKSSDKAAQLQAEANRQATELARQTEDTRRREFEAQQAELKRQWDVSEANKAPYRAASSAALGRLSDLLGIPGLSASGGGGGSAAPTGPLPQRPSDLTAAIAQANQIAYGWANKHSDQSYWASDWAKDPEYTWRRMLGEGAGRPGDIATSGPYAGVATARSPAAAMPTGSTPTVAPPTNPLAANYAPVVPFRALYDPRMRA